MLESLPEDTDPSAIRALKSDPRIWARNSLRHPIDDSRPYDFKTLDGKPLTHLLHDDGPLDPASWGDMNVFLFARGELKSTVCRFISCWAHDCFPSLDTYMTAPTEGQVENFTEKLKKNVRESNLDSRRVKDSLYHQQFEVLRERDDGTTYPVHGHFKTDSGYREESLRGPHSQVGVVDETQDLKKDVFDTYLPCIDMGHQDHSAFPVIFLIGTPKEEGSFYEDIWLKSDQRTWDAEKQEWVFQSEPDEYEIGEHAANELGIDPDEVEQREVHGWHVDWMNSPLHSDGQILEARERMSEMRFTNEVKAQFYSPEDNLLTRSIIEERLFDDGRGFVQRRRSEDSTVTVVVDWGGGKDKNASDTAIAVGEQQTFDGDQTSSEILNVRFPSSDATKAEQIRMVEDWIQQYQADHCLVDYGFGQQAMESLQNGNDTRDPDGYLDTVVGVKYGHIKNKSEIKWESDSGDKRFFTCDKTRSISRAVDWIRNGSLTLPTDDLTFGRDGADGDRIVDQLTAPYKHLKTTPTGQKKVRVETDDNEKDDMADVITFLWLAFEEVGATDYYTGMSVTKRPGYS